MPEGHFLRTDNDGHWYLVPEKRLHEFRDWNDMDPEDDDFDPDQFQEHYLDNPYTLKIFAYDDGKD